MPRCRTRGPAWARWPGWQQRFPPASFADQGWPAWALRDRVGRLHPLCGVYTKQCLPAIQAALAAGEHRVGRLFQSVGGQVISLEGTSLPDAVVCNVNTPEELKELLQS